MNVFLEFVGFNERGIQNLYYVGDKKVTLTKVKNRPGKLSPISDGKTYTGEFERTPEVGKRAWFSGDKLEDWVVTSIIQKIDTKIEPGIMYLETINSIYKVTIDNE